MNRIEEFQCEFRFLSNFYPAPFLWRGHKFPTSEHAYQFTKAVKVDDKLHIRYAKTPGEAKRIAKVIEIKPNWENIKISIMHQIVREKFFQNPELATKLIQTENFELIEGNRWGDQFWGKIINFNGQLYGENWLGRILMLVRSEIHYQSSLGVIICG